MCTEASTAGDGWLQHGTWIPRVQELYSTGASYSIYQHRRSACVCVCVRVIDRSSSIPLCYESHSYSVMDFTQTQWLHGIASKRRLGSAQMAAIHDLSHAMYLMEMLAYTAPWNFVPNSGLWEISPRHVDGRKCCKQSPASAQTPRNSCSVCSNATRPAVATFRPHLLVCSSSVHL